MRMKALLTGLALALAIFPWTPSHGVEVSKRKGFEIEITSPTTGDFRFGRAEITAEVKTADMSLVEKVEFYVDGKLIFIDKEPPFACVFDFGTEPHSYIIKATAYHQRGVTVTDTSITRRVFLNYQVEVNRVVLNATVQNDDKEFVLDLKKEDFELEEDDHPQEIINFYLEERPIVLCLLLDSSGSMQGRMDDVHLAASKFVESLRTEDQALVIDFDEKVFLLQDFTHDVDLLKKAISSTYAEGGTALYDSLHAAFRKLRAHEGRRAIIILSDGEDTNSKFSYRRVLEGAKTNDIIIYSIGLGTSFLDLGIRGSLKELAEETGGRSFFPGKAKELEGIYRQIAEELRSQYYLTYSPTNEDWNGRWRKIKLKVTGQKGLEVRARRGYYAVRQRRPGEIQTGS